MSDERKARRKKLLIRYLILAACILVVAAVTVITVFAVNDWFRTDMTLDGSDGGNNNDEGNAPSGGGNKDDGNSDDKGNNDDGNKDDKDTPTSSDGTFAFPVAAMDVSNPYDFCFDVSLGHWHFHEGIDISAAVGTDVVACLDGTIESITLEDKLDGNTITISHADGVTTVYRFLEINENLKVGDKIKKGDKIGTVSQPTGAEFKQDPHLHFEVIKGGVKTDPTAYFNISEK